MYPEINYNHVLAELSVNRDDPCEVVRELISNAYDAAAQNMYLFPVLRHEGFLFADDGIGVDDQHELKGVTPWVAFFSIGKSTKTLGVSIGYKCQGTKLCFASSRFCLISRCQNENHENQWRYLEIDNPKTNLTPEFDITPKVTQSPNDVIRSFFSPADKSIEAILEQIASAQLDGWSSGAIVLVRGYETEDFSRHFDTTKTHSYLREYIRYCTRHGDMRVLRPKQTGFTQQHSKNFQKAAGYNINCQLHLWRGAQLETIFPGFPYLDKPADEATLKKPSEVSRLRDSTFFARHAASFQHEGNTYYVTLAVDGNRRVLQEIDALDRRGSFRSGIRLTDQRGAFICSQGVKICPVNWLFQEPLLSNEYEVLGSDDAQSHYILMVNGSFELVTNRNSIAEPSLRILKSKSFLEHIKKFLNNAEKDDVFEQLVLRLKRETEMFRLEKYLEQHESVKASIQYRERFRIECDGPLSGQWLVAPEVGGEHWVGALYILLSYHVDHQSPYAEFWRKPRTFSGRGIDSFAAPLPEVKVSPEVHQAVEYKWRFVPGDLFNHPFIATDDIVAWEVESMEEGDKVEDSYEYFGTISKSGKLQEVGYLIEDIQSNAGEIHEGVVRVIGLKELIKKTFDSKWTKPPNNRNHKNHKK